MVKKRSALKPFTALMPPGHAVGAGHLWRYHQEHCLPPLASDAPLKRLPPSNRFRDRWPPYPPGKAWSSSFPPPAWATLPLAIPAMPPETYKERSWRFAPQWSGARNWGPHG